jgi:hypothetical protein
MDEWEVDENESGSHLDLLCGGWMSMRQPRPYTFSRSPLLCIALLAPPILTGTVRDGSIAAEPFSLLSIGVAAWDPDARALFLSTSPSSPPSCHT